MPDPTQFELRGEFIALNDLLKATGLAGSGGEAKAMIADGQVRVDGQVETRKTCKIRAGQAVELGGQALRIVAQPRQDPT